jgi:hypothetical protein
MTFSYSAKIKYIAEDKTYFVEFPDLPGCLTEGDTLEEAKRNAKSTLPDLKSSIPTIVPPPRTSTFTPVLRSYSLARSVKYPSLLIEQPLAVRDSAFAGRIVAHKKKIANNNTFR